MRFEISYYFLISLIGVLNNLNLKFTRFLICFRFCRVPRTPQVLEKINNKILNPTCKIGSVGLKQKTVLNNKVDNNIFEPALRMSVEPHDVAKDLSWLKIAMLLNGPPTDTNFRRSR